MKTLMKKKVLLAFLVLLAGAVTYAATAVADAPPKVSKADRDTPAVVKDIKGGKAKNVTPHGRGKHTSGVWTGCKFVYLTTDVTDYEFDDGSLTSVSSNPEPMPPKDPACVVRNPTEAELREMYANVDQRNAGNRPPGAETRPLPPVELPNLAPR